MKIFDLFDPYSIKNLRKRASKLPECPYRLILETSADQLENKKVNKNTVKKIIKYVRTGNQELTFVAIQLLNLNKGQISVALNLVGKMKGR